MNLEVSSFEIQCLGFPLSILARILRDFKNTVLVIKVGNCQAQDSQMAVVIISLKACGLVKMVRFALGFPQGACHFRVIPLEQNAE
jgi:hypothetical protein